MRQRMYGGVRGRSREAPPTRFWSILPRASEASYVEHFVELTRSKDHLMVLMDME